MKLFELGSTFRVFAIPSSWRLMVLHLSLLYSKAPAQWPHCPQFGRGGRAGFPCAQAGGGHIKQRVHTGDSVFTSREIKQRQRWNGLDFADMKSPTAP